jgi:hypothetical protein
MVLTQQQIREDLKTGVYVENLREVEVTCVQDVVQLLVQVSIIEPHNKISPQLHTVNLLYPPQLGNFLYSLFTFLDCAWSREPRTGKLQQQI